MKSIRVVSKDDIVGVEFSSELCKYLIIHMYHEADSLYRNFISVQIGVSYIKMMFVVFFILLFIFNISSSRNMWT
jgi:hypothetical protein